MTIAAGLAVVDMGPSPEAERSPEAQPAPEVAEPVIAEDAPDPGPGPEALPVEPADPGGEAGGPPAPAPGEDEDADDSAMRSVGAEPVLPASDDAGEEDVTGGDLPEGDIALLSLEALLQQRFASPHHRHAKGEWMMGYRYTFMRMSGMREGLSTLSRDDVLADFPVTPTSMSTQAHVISLMFAPGDRLTLMAMLPVVHKSMEHVDRTGAEFTTESTGVGDLSAMGHFIAHDGPTHKALVLIGGLLPTGSVRHRDTLPNGSSVRLPYPMQIGTGTVAADLGLEYDGIKGRWAWGADAGTRLRIGENALGYRFGHEAAAQLWGSAEATPWLAFHLASTARFRQSIRGADLELDPAQVPTARADTHGYRRLDVRGGFSLIVPRGPLAGLRLLVEGGLPVVQHLDGPQLASRLAVTGALEFTWSFPR